MTCCKKYQELLDWDCCGCSYPWLEDNERDNKFILCPYCGEKL